MNRTIASIAALVVIAVIGAWYMVLWKPINHDMSAAHQRLQSAQTDQLNATLQRAALKFKEQQLPSETAKAAALTDAAPAGADIPGMIDEVARAAAVSGVSWQSESQSEANANGTSASSSASSAGTPTGPVTPVTLSLSVTGRYTQILDFITQLQAAPRLIKVSSLTLGSGASAATGSSEGTTPSGPLADASQGGAMTTQISAVMYEADSALPTSPGTGR